MRIKYNVSLLDKNILLFINQITDGAFLDSNRGIKLLRECGFMLEFEEQSDIVYGSSNPNWSVIIENEILSDVLLNNKESIFSKYILNELKKEIINLDILKHKFIEDEYSKEQIVRFNLPWMLDLKFKTYIIKMVDSTKQIYNIRPIMKYRLSHEDKVNNQIADVMINSVTMYVNTESMKFDGLHFV